MPSSNMYLLSPKEAKKFYKYQNLQCYVIYFEFFSFHFKIDFKMAEEHTNLNEEKLTQLIRKIFQEEFKKQEVHITNIISSNIKITMEEIKKSQESSIFWGYLGH